MYFRRKQSQGRFYLQIVESHRSGDQVRQRVIATLGRLDELEASGQLDRLLRSGARFVQQAMVLDAARTGDVPAIAVRRIGPALLFERLWRDTGCQDVIAALARRRGHRFALERAVFLRRFGSRRRSLARRVSHRRLRRPRSASPLPRHGLAR
jgi:HEAT repeat protein